VWASREIEILRSVVVNGEKVTVARRRLLNELNVDLNDRQVRTQFDKEKESWQWRPWGLDEFQPRFDLFARDPMPSIKDIQSEFRDRTWEQLSSLTNWILKGEFGDDMAAALWNGPEVQAQ
jgi:hypothetical protein